MYFKDMIFVNGFGVDKNAINEQRNTEFKLYSEYWNCEINSENFYGMDNLTGCNFYNCTFNNLKFSDISQCSFKNCGFIDCYMEHICIEHSNFIDCNLKRITILDINAQETNFSNCEMNYNPVKFLENNFEFTSEGMIGYKIFGLHYQSPKEWDIKEGGIINTSGNTDIFISCASGFNIGSKLWIMQNGNLSSIVWKVLVPYKSLCGVVVPYNSDGKIRVVGADVVLLSQTTIKDLLG